jgi:hypothetical protein
VSEAHATTLGPGTPRGLALAACRALGAAHFAWGAALIVAAGWFAIAVARALPHMSTGARGANVMSAIFMATMGSLPGAVLGTWMLALGIRLGSPNARLRAALLWTHLTLLVPGGVALAVGLTAMRAAARSAAHGGGLMGPIAAVPLVFGAPTTLLAAASIVVAVTALPRAGATSGR